MNSQRDKNGRFVKGSSPWHKGKTGIFSEEYRKKLSDAKKGKPNWRKGVVGKYRHTQEWKEMMSKKLKGHETSEETKKKISDANKGEKNGCWKGGVSIGQPSRLSNYQYRLFRNRVLKRDKCCVLCGSLERLEVDHLKPYSIYVELRMDESNVRVLCHACHKKTDTYGLQTHNYLKKQNETR